MIKYYLVPVERYIHPTRHIPAVKPRGIQGFNWSGMIFADKEYYMVVINTKYEDKLKDFEKDKDVVSLDDVKNKDKIKEKLDIDVLDTEDFVEKIGKTKDNKFTKDKLYVMED